MRGIKSLFVLVFLMAGGTVAAQSFSVTSATGAQGDSVTVTISYNAGGNADGLEGEMTYDSTNLTADITACGGLGNPIGSNVLGDIIMGCTDDGAGLLTFIGNSGTSTAAPTGSFGDIDFTIANPTTPAPPPNVVLPLDILNEVFADGGANVAPGTSTDGMVTVSIASHPSNLNSSSRGSAKRSSTSVAAPAAFTPTTRAVVLSKTGS